jgi:hypothetical protein
MVFRQPCSASAIDALTEVVAPVHISIRQHAVWRITSLWPAPSPGRISKSCWEIGGPPTTGGRDQERKAPSDQIQAAWFVAPWAFPKDHNRTSGPQAARTHALVRVARDPTGAALKSRSEEFARPGRRHRSLEDSSSSKWRHVKIFPHRALFTWTASFTH